MKISFGFWACLGFWILSGCQEVPSESGPREFCLVTWNVHNLFDAEYQGTEYPEFDPRKNWTEAQMLARMDSVAQVLKEIQGGNLDLIALQEVESPGVLDFLDKRFLGGRYPHKVFRKGPGQVIGLGFLSKHPIQKVHSFQPLSTKADPLRPLLEIELPWQGQRVIAINNHWKSRQPSPESTEALRLQSAKMLQERLEAHKVHSPQALVFVCGDLNTSRENPGKKGPYALSSQGVNLRARGDGPGPWDLWETSGAGGSYFHQNQWEKLDHIFLLEPTKPGGTWELKAFEVFSKPWMLTPDGRPRAYSPRDLGGISDHLPLAAVMVFYPRSP